MKPHNPDNLSPGVIEVGQMLMLQPDWLTSVTSTEWETREARLLDEDEITSGPLIEGMELWVGKCNLGQWHATTFSGSDNQSTYRTRLTRAELQFARRTQDVSHIKFTNPMPNTPALHVTMLERLHQARLHLTNLQQAKQNIEIEISRAEGHVTGLEEAHNLFKTEGAVGALKQQLEHPAK